MNNQVWKRVKGCPGYMVSNMGMIKSMDRVVVGKNGVKKRLKGRALIQTPSPQGYMLVRLSAKNNPQGVHRYVAEAFLPNPEGKATVNHKNGNKKDNRASNLEWATYSENIKHSFDRLGRKSPKAMLGRRGADCPNSKRVMQLSDNGEVIRIFASCKEAARFVGVCKSAISACANGKTKTSGGFSWSFKK